MAIVMVMLLLGAAVAYAIELAGTGLVLQFVAFVPLLILEATWLTGLSSSAWNSAGPWPVIGAIVLVAVALFGPIGLGKVLEDAI